MGCRATAIDEASIEQIRLSIDDFGHSLNRVLSDIPIVMTSIAEQRVVLFIGHQVSDARIGELHALLAGAAFVDSVNVSTVGEGFIITIALNIECHQKITRLSSIFGEVLLPKVIAASS